MAFYTTILLLLLLCSLALNVKGNTENSTEAKIPEQKEDKQNHESQTHRAPHSGNQTEDKQNHESQTHRAPHSGNQTEEKQNHESQTHRAPHSGNQTEVSNNDVNATDNTQRTTNATGQEVHPVISTSNHEKNATREHGDGENDPKPTASNLTTTRPLSNDTMRPAFRRYIHYAKNDTPVVEKLLDDIQWSLVGPAKQPGEGHDTNITRFQKLENGTRITLRSKYEYSYDGKHWFWPTRVRYEDDGTNFKYKYKFGPRKWVEYARNEIYFGNKTNLTYEDLGPGRVDLEVSSFPTHLKSRLLNPSIEHSYNGTLSHRKQLYEYGPPLDQNRARYDRRPYYNDYRYSYRPYGSPRWGPPPPPLLRPPPPPLIPPSHQGYYDSYRNGYSDSRYVRPDPYYDGRRDGVRDDPYYDRGRRPDYYDDRRYRNSGPHEDRRYENDGAYDRRYENSGPREDRRYEKDGAYDDRRYDKGYDDTRYRTEGGTNDDKNYARRYEDDRRRYNENYDPRRDRPSSRRRSQTYVDSHERLKPEDREHGDSFEIRKWKFVYMDRNKIPEDKRKQEKYFLLEYHDMLAKASRHIWKSHRDIRTILPDYEELKEEGVITDTYVIPVINGSMTLLNDLASKISSRMEKNMTTEDITQPVEKGAYGKTMNNFDKMLEIFRQARRPETVNKKLENLISKVIDQKKYLFITYCDLTHMFAVLRRTMKRYNILPDTYGNKTEHD